ncbi:DUF115 domain-containing protein [Entomospira entomophila]|uniref:DUF115 domain-containing protein n=1 Tax=Entomospira entomophila TaxID=2719988 RepID=A0A968GDD5_9SPIO|nr:6-hydroxymethylpterin diphosphokinase MptE-like protein [Entomospira entomophilus]NIZ40369.1 DUF115 domain-containing protein [Entomospira entomophilus]WDI35928.1 DUF115 domain-containing protein [Entomospira entomophilus]
MHHWQENISIIQHRWPILATHLRNTVALSLEVLFSKSGHPIPHLNHRSLHSMYDPIKEAQKSLLHVKESCVILGIGGGYLLTEALQKNLSFICVIEPSLAFLRAICEVFPLQHLLADPRMHLIVSEVTTNIFHELEHHYQPIIHGDLALIAPRIIMDSYPSFYQSFKEQWQQWCQNLAQELSTIQFFGQRWTKNIIVNIASITETEPPKQLSPKKEIWIAGAGPSLETIQKAYASHPHKNIMIIASDASLLPLYSYGLSPDIIVSIDAQIFVATHFLDTPERELPPIVADLSIHPSVTRHRETLFFAGSHPLSQLTPLPHLPTSSGNVGTIAYLLALHLQATTIRHFGLDFAYINAKPYASPSYLYQSFTAESHRLHPLSQQVTSLTFRGAPLTYDATTHTYQSSLLAFYHDQFNHVVHRGYPSYRWESRNFNGLQFLQQYLDAITHLPSIEASQWSLLSQKEQQLYFSLLPSMLHPQYSHTKFKENLEKNTLFVQNIIHQHLN